MSAEPQPQGPDWPRLNAYVDGELDAGERAEVAAAAARDRAVAQALATLSQLKAATQEAFAAQEPPPFLPRRGIERRWLWPTLVASLMAAVLLAGHHFRSSMDDAASTLDRHRAWTAMPPAAVAGGDKLAVAFDRRLGHLVVPDLEAVGLRLVHLAIASTGQPSLHAGYAGPRGCRLSVFVGTDPRLPETAAPPPGSALRSASWTVAGTTYLAIAEGMPTARFAAVVALLRAASAPPQGDRVPALGDAIREARAASAPCLS
ncbi:MAG: hypothetical protein FJX68_08950 [Alphaproteobacteria bacterium]|nr:hypothetical protein [Alphaproteobacteria bacterium]